MKSDIKSLKKNLENAIDEKISELKSLSEEYKNIDEQLDVLTAKMTTIAKELKQVEYIVRATGNEAYADLCNQLLQKGE